MKHIAIMGTGMVGGSLDRYFTSRDIVAGLYDPPKGLNDPSVLDRADIVFVCVPTPYYPDTGFDRSFIDDALKMLKGDKIVVIKSTVMPGTTAQLQKEYPHLRMMYNPEFLTEITADQDMCFPDRQILGTTERSYTVAADVMAMLPLAPFERIMPSTSAEMVKYFGNTWFALKVAFANQFYDVCQKMGVEYDVVKEGAAADKRIGRTHLDVIHKGYRGYGGKCIPKDTRTLIQLSKKHGTDFSLLEAAEAYNNALVSSQGIDIKWEDGSPRKNS
jgi:UDPglucose 6-dehydrogenase